MSKINLELRVTKFGSIWSETIFLEDQTDEYQQIDDWSAGDGYKYIQLPDYPVKGPSLEVHLACRGIAGGTATCEVIINDESVGSVTARAEDTRYSSESFIL
jgi:hypothetical protein